MFLWWSSINKCSKNKVKMVTLVPANTERGKMTTLKIILLLGKSVTIFKIIILFFKHRRGKIKMKIFENIIIICFYYN